MVPVLGVCRVTPNNSKIVAQVPNSEAARISYEPDILRFHLGHSAAQSRKPHVRGTEFGKALGYPTGSWQRGIFSRRFPLGGESEEIRVSRFPGAHNVCRHAESKLQVLCWRSLL